MFFIEEIYDRVALIKKAEADPLVRFVLGDRDLNAEIAELRLTNLNSIKTVARKYKVRYIYIGEGEICGCENKQYNRWPAMWAIANELGFPGSCGNTDQYQKSGVDNIFLDPGHFGGWDLVEDRKLDDKEVADRNFHFVVTKRVRL